MENSHVSQELDAAKQGAFMGKVLGDLSASMTTVLASIGDRLGLFKDLAAHGASTSSDVAGRTKMNERYVREWLGGMATAGYVDYDPASQRFTMPIEHATCLADEGGPFFVGGCYQMFRTMGGEVVDRVMDCFQNGGGVPQSAYPEEYWDGLERFSAGWFENLLLSQWIPAMPDVKKKLERGALVADVGCGRGRALIKLAESFPQSRFVGFDAFPPTIERATRSAAKAGVGDRVRFEVRDAGRGLPEHFDVITTFDVVHDAVDPKGLLRSICTGLKNDGIYVCLDVNCADRLEENKGPLGAMFHGVSVLYCMTTSLANGGVGLGTLGFPESSVKAMCQEAGFGVVRRLPLENPFNNLYEIRP